MQFEYKTLPLHGGELDSAGDGLTEKLNDEVTVSDDDTRLRHSQVVERNS